MKDPHVHVQHDFIFGFNFMRALFSDALKIGLDPPKTVRTGCDRRRAFTMTSTIPAAVTCLGCIDYALQYLVEAIATGELALELCVDDPPLSSRIQAELTQRTSLHTAFQTKVR